MKLMPAIRMVAIEINSKKLHYFLSSLGVAIGIAAVIIAVSVGYSGQDKILGEVDRMSPNLIMITPADIIPGNPHFRGLSYHSLVMNDYKKIKNYIGPLAISPILAGNRTVHYRKKLIRSSLVAANADYFKMNHIDLAYGRIFTKSEGHAAAGVAIVGTKVLDALFGSKYQNYIGKIVRIAHHPFRIIGITSKMGTNSSNRDLDNRVFIPFTSGKERIFNRSYLTAIYLTVNQNEIPYVKKSINSILKESHKKSIADFVITTQNDIIAKRKKTILLFTALIGTIAAISLFVGAIGVSGMMLVTVKRNYRQIGIKRAIGATKFDIVFEVMILSIFMTLAGSIIGFMFGFVMSVLIVTVLHWHLIFNLFFALLAIFISVVIGVASGLVPSIIAAKTDVSSVMKEG